MSAEPTELPGEEAEFGWKERIAAVADAWSALLQTRVAIVREERAAVACVIVDADRERAFDVRARRARGQRQPVRAAIGLGETVRREPARERIVRLLRRTEPLGLLRSGQVTPEVGRLRIADVAEITLEAFLVVMPKHERQRHRLGRHARRFRGKVR